MKALFIGSLFVLGCLLGGCTAGTNTDLLTYDNISASVKETRTGVGALVASINNSDNKVREQLADGIAQSVATATEHSSLSAEDKVKLIEAVRSQVSIKLGDILEQEKRKAKLVEAINDNLDYIDELCRQGKDFTIYKSDVNAQWKSYLQAQAHKQLEGAK